MPKQSDELLTAREIAIKEFNSVRGRLLSVIESVGMPQTQEEAIKTLIKSFSYQSQAVVAELIDKLEPGDKQLFRYQEQKLQ
jgi:hypothetical protein